jgi:hypothetical protein
MTVPGYEALNVYYGDLHGHTSVGYGQGTVEEAYRNARLQLDFASVTAHGAWPDMPEGDQRLASVVEYHRDGFRRAARGWAELEEVTEAVYEPGRFVSFPSFEWHSIRYGDYNVYFREPGGEILHAARLGELHAQLDRRNREGRPAIAIPHHVGYRTGHRGIDWEAFSAERSPVVEIFSMHGLAESGDGPYPYLHTMGPCDLAGTMQHGLKLGNVFGVIGSTDHHSAHPGSYGHGRAGVWAEDLTREGLWKAIAQRRTYALTGDRIDVEFSVNGQPMGGVARPAVERQIEVDVTGGGALDYVELVFNNRPIHRWNTLEAEREPAGGPWKVALEMGWGKKGEAVDWRVELEVVGGDLLSVEPRLRGRDVLSPQENDGEALAFSSWEQVDRRTILLNTRTWGNPTTVTPATQAISLEVQGDLRTEIRGVLNGRPVRLTLGDLADGPRSGYLGGFLTPGYLFHRAAPRSLYAGRFSFSHEMQGKSGRRDWYYLRVRQKNGQWAWTSPVWVEPGE